MAVQDEKLRLKVLEKKYQTISFSTNVMNRHLLQGKNTFYFQEKK